MQKNHFTELMPLFMIYFYSRFVNNISSQIVFYVQYIVLSYSMGIYLILYKYKDRWHNAGAN